MQAIRTTAGALSALVVLCAATPARAAAPGDPGSAQAGTVTRVSVSSAGAQADRKSFPMPATSADGRYVAFSSGATTLVEPDANNVTEVFVRDLRTGTTTVASGTSTGERILASDPTLSADGRLVAFTTGAAAVPEDTDGETDVYVRDRGTGAVTLASVPPAGEAWHSAVDARISAGGRHVVMIVAGTAPAPQNVYLRDLRRGATVQVDTAGDGTPANGDAWSATVSPNGRYVAFGSMATNLVPADTEPDMDIFVRDLWTGDLRQATLSSTGGQILDTDTSVSISADGSRVAFTSRNQDVVPNDTNTSRHSRDIFIRDLRAGTTELASLNSVGTQVGGRHHAPMISGNGRYVTFASSANDLAPGDTNPWEDVFVRDLRTGKSTVVSTVGGESDQHSEFPAISHDGRTIAFLSSATTLVPADTNGVADTFAWERGHYRS